MMVMANISDGFSDPTDIEDLLRDVPEWGTVFWAIEEVLDLGVDGQEYHVPLGLHDCWTVSIGIEERVIEIDITSDPHLPDGHALVIDDRVPHDDDTQVMEGSARVLWCGPRSSTAWLEFVSDAGLRLVPASSVDHVGMNIKNVLNSIRPGVNVVHDSAWEHHEHPLARLLTERLNGSTIALDDDPTITFTHEAYAEWLALDLDRDLHLLAATADDIEELTRREESARWTDGTVIMEDG